LSGTRLELSASWILACAIVLAHSAAAACVLLVLPGLAGMLLAAALLALGLAAAWARALHGSAASVRALELDGPKIRVELKDRRCLAAELGARRHVGRWLVSLPLARPARRTILVTRDMLGAEEFRRLRLWALWGRLPKVAPKQLLA
jgi:hypothetical protein